MMPAVPKTDTQITTWLEHEYAQPFEGWDFSYLQDRLRTLGSLPWDYRSVVAQYLPNAKSLLDIDTGGGEVLAEMLSNLQFSGRASAVEAYAPNVPVARKRLVSLGVEVYDTSQNPAPLEDSSFDLVIDRHGGSLAPSEIYRILQPGGRYITQQVGDCTNMELRNLFDCEPITQPDWPHNAGDAKSVFSNLGFEIETLNEQKYPARFLDVGALVYYIKAVPWEVPGFSIERDAEILIELHQKSAEVGFAIDATHHTFLLVARKA